MKKPHSKSSGPDLYSFFLKNLLPIKVKNQKSKVIINIFWNKK